MTHPDGASSTRGGIFAGVDRALFLAVFTERLRSAGVRVPIGAIRRSALAVDAIGPTLRVADLYWALRLSLIDHHNDVELFDRVFDAVFSSEFTARGENRRGLPQSASPAGDAEHKLGVDAAASVVTGAGLMWSALPSVSGVDDDGDAEDDEPDPTAIPELAPSSDMFLVERPFDMLDDAELAEVERRLESAIVSWPQRRSRRRQRWASGSAVDLRATLRRAMRSGGEPLALAMTRQRRRPRRIVVLVDVSGSMEAYARAYLHLTRALTLAGRAEVFAFGTDLTRITAALRHRSPSEAIALATDAVADRFGGTRIAHAVTSLLRHQRWAGLVRGAIVVVVSDGWDADAPDELRRAMERMHRRAHRVVWVNPRLAAADFEPRTGAFAAAIPHCDAVISGHSLAAIDELVEVLDAA